MLNESIINYINFIFKKINFYLENSFNLYFCKNIFL